MLPGGLLGATAAVSLPRAASCQPPCSSSLLFLRPSEPLPHPTPDPTASLPPALPRPARRVQAIFKRTPHDKQVMMFSATLSSEIRPICKKFMRDVRSRPAVHHIVAAAAAAQACSSSSSNRNNNSIAPAHAPCRASSMICSPSWDSWGSRGSAVGPRSSPRSSGRCGWRGRARCPCRQCS